MVDPTVEALGFAGSAGFVDSVRFVGSVGPVDFVDVDVNSDFNAIDRASSVNTGVGRDAGSAGDVGDADKSSAGMIVAITGVEEGAAELDIE